MKESENKIKEYRRQIQDIKGVVRCEKCGAEIGNNVAFCSSCGAKAPMTSTVEANGNFVQCSGCGASMNKDAKFCTVCGKVVQSEKIELPSDSVCTFCGAEMANDALFCTKCGNKRNI